MNRYLHVLRCLMLTVFCLFGILSETAYAVSPEWITHTTKGRVKYTEAVQYSQLIYRYAFQYGVDPSLIFRIIKVESNFNPKARYRGSLGLMQIIPKYHKDKIQGRNIFNPVVNIEVGIRIIAEYLDRYKTENKALRAYNGSLKSNHYPKLIASVPLKDFVLAYPGSDNRKGVIRLSTEYTQVEREQEKEMITYQHDFKSFGLPAEWSDTYKCTKCEKMVTYDAEDCSSETRCNEWYQDVPCVPIQLTEK